MGISWESSRQIEFDNNGDRADGCLAYFFEGGTTTPLTVYEDADESTPHDNPVVADANGRWPRVFIPFITSYDVKVVTEGGTQLYYDQELPNPDPIEEAEDEVEPEQLLSTGDVIWRGWGGDRAGFVRVNGRTIGNAASGATERANADTEDLFLALWNNHTNTICPVSGGRGASAAADYAANKTLTLFDARATALMGVADMGASSVARFTNTPFSLGSDGDAGAVCGLNDHTLTTAQSAAHTHTFSATTAADGGHSHSFSGTTSTDGSHDHDFTTSSDGAHTHTWGTTLAVDTDNPDANAGSSVQGAYGTTSSNGAHTHTGTVDADGSHSHTYSGSTSSQAAHTHAVSGTSDSTGGGTAHNNVPRAVLGTFYMKL